MIDYNKLSNQAKLRRLKPIARHALETYGIQAQNIVFHGYDTNLLYRVTDVKGRKYVLRLATPGWRTIDGLQAEAMWLDALAIDTDILVPAIIRTSDGRAVLSLGAEGVPDLWNTTLMSWVPGKLLGHYLAAENLKKMGILFAKMHLHGKSWKRPPNFSPAVFNHYLSRGEEEHLFSAEKISECDGKDIAVLRDMRNRVEAEYANLDPSDLRVIHCDLWHDNIKLHKGVLIPFDFEDTILGFRLHDIAMAMLDLLEDTDANRYPILLNAFRSGYENHLSWPEGSMELLQIGRLLWKVNLAAKWGQKWFNESVPFHADVIRRFNTSGVISFP